MPSVSVLDYGAGNIKSLVNALHFIYDKLGLDGEVKMIQKPSDIMDAEKLIFPGVGAFGSAMNNLNKKGYSEPLLQYLKQNRPFFGICIGLQTLFESSEESPVKGLSFLKGRVKRFDVPKQYSVPHMGWNGLNVRKHSNVLLPDQSMKVYFVHSYCAQVTDALKDWVLATTNYGCEFVSAVQKGNILATQFHPEKSGKVGLDLLSKFLELSRNSSPSDSNLFPVQNGTKLAKRIIACLDVRSNDAGDLVVTKGDQYDVREREKDKIENGKLKKGQVRNLGKPVELAKRYYNEGADEIAFLNITSFRNCPINDLPMLSVLREAAKEIFVPMTVGGGIRDTTMEYESDLINDDGSLEKTLVKMSYSAVEVAGLYFRSVAITRSFCEICPSQLTVEKANKSDHLTNYLDLTFMIDSGGADKVSIGSDAVIIAEEYIKSGGIKTGKTSIETIAEAYGRQAVVISVDPKRVYVKGPENVPHHVIKTKNLGPNEEEYCWYQCTIKGGREGRPLGVYELVTICETLGAGEIMLNCIDKDGTNSGYDHELISMVKSSVTIPVIASSGAGNVHHFSEVFRKANPDAALAAGIFHRSEVSIKDVKSHVNECGIPVRICN